MSVKVLMKNMGGLEGEHTFEFVEGAINIVRAPNAAGKSTLIKAMALCLSYPFKNDTLLKIARDVGLLKQPEENIEPLIHINSDSADAVIEADGKTWSIALVKDGRIISPHEEGDERFVVTSVITRESKILRSLITGETDFNWLIESVSLAKKYDIVAAILEEEILKVEELLHQIDIKRKEIAKIRERVKNLSKTIDEGIKREQELSKELSELLTKNPEIKALREKRDALLTERRKIEDDIKEMEEEIKRLQRELDEETRKYRGKIDQRDRLRGILEQKNKEIERIRERIEELNDNLKNFEGRIKEIHEKETELRVEEGKALALLELCQNALKLVSKSSDKRAQCFLCKQGYLTLSFLEQERLLIENKLYEIRNKIAKLLHERNNLYSYRNEREKLEKELKSLKSEISGVAGSLAGLEKDLLKYESDTKALKMKIEQYTKSLKSLREKHAVCENEIAKIDEIIGMLGEEEKRLVSEISELRGKISLLKEQKDREVKMLEDASYTEVFGFLISVEKAYKICNDCIGKLREVYNKVAFEAKKERKAVVEVFNLSVKNVLKETGFDLDVWIDPRDYKLYVRDLKSNSDISPRILSETQRYILSLVMHIALKLFYTPNIPLLLIDEVVLSFDERRKNVVMRYLLDLAKNNGWAVILTELGSENKIAVQVIKDL